MGCLVVNLGPLIKSANRVVREAAFTSDLFGGFSILLDR